MEGLQKYYQRVIRTTIEGTINMLIDREDQLHLKLIQPRGCNESNDQLFKNVSNSVDNKLIRAIKGLGELVRKGCQVGQIISCFRDWGKLCLPSIVESVFDIVLFTQGMDSHQSPLSRGIRSCPEWSSVCSCHGCEPSPI